METASKAALLAEINESLLDALGRLVADGIIPASQMPPFTSSPCREPSRGDYTSNCAMVAAAALNTSADVIARKIVACISFDGSCFSGCSCSGGYINFTLSPRWYYTVIMNVLNGGEALTEPQTDDIPQNTSKSDCEAAQQSLFDVVSLPQRTEALLTSLIDYGMDGSTVSDGFSVPIAALLKTNEEKQLIKHLSLYADIIKDCSCSYTSLMSYCGRLSMLYGSFICACPVRNTPPDIMKARAALCRAVYNVSSAVCSALKLDKDTKRKD